MDRGGERGGPTDAPASTGSRDPAVRLDRVRKHFGELVAVREMELYVAHGQDEALTMSDRIAVMSDGVIEQVDTPETVTVYELPRRTSGRLLRPHENTPMPMSFTVVPQRRADGLAEIPTQREGE